MTDGTKLGITIDPNLPTGVRDDWANYRNFVHHKNALNMIFRYAPPRNVDVQYDIERAADEEGVSVADYLKGPSHE